MDSIITQEVSSDVLDSIKDIDTLPNENYKEAIEVLLDQEEHLIGALEQILEKNSEELQLMLPADNRIPVKELSVAVSKNITIALVTGFLCERYSRDILEDNKLLNQNEDFKRLYESVSIYVKRKLNKINKSIDLKNIALNETRKRPK